MAGVSPPSEAKFGRRKYWGQFYTIRRSGAAAPLLAELGGHLGGEIALFALDALADLEAMEPGHRDRRAGVRAGGFDRLAHL